MKLNKQYSSGKCLMTVTDFTLYVTDFTLYSFMYVLYAVKLVNLFVNVTDSTVLAYVLKALNQRYDYGVNLVLLSVDEGITGYRDDSLEVIPGGSEVKH